MALNLQTLRSLIRQGLPPAHPEIDCDDCLRQVDEYAEKVLAHKGPREGLGLVEQHLEICTECREEFEALLRALRALYDEDGSPGPGGL
jgi:hypothetical protein